MEAGPVKARNIHRNQIEDKSCIGELESPTDRAGTTDDGTGQKVCICRGTGINEFMQMEPDSAHDRSSVLSKRIRDVGLIRFWKTSRTSCSISGPGRGRVMRSVQEDSVSRRTVSAARPPRDAVRNGVRPRASPPISPDLGPRPPSTLCKIYAVSNGSEVLTRADMRVLCSVSAPRKTEVTLL